MVYKIKIFIYDLINGLVCKFLLSKKVRNSIIDIKQEF